MRNNWAGNNVPKKLNKFNDEMAINRDDIFEEVDSDDERELNDEEKSILQQFEENDKELEEIAA